MSQLICNLPNTKVYVRKEYLRDGKDGHGEFVEGHWVTAKSIPGRAFYFETFLPEYGAVFDKLPITAFVSSPETPTTDYDLPNLQFWNCMDYGITCIYKQFIGSMDFEVFTRTHDIVKGTYMFTLDNYHVNTDQPDYSTAEVPAEHKSFNVIELENGQYALYPNNRMRVYDNSLTPQTPKTPDFMVSTEFYQVENGYEYRLGDTDEYFWKTKELSMEILLYIVVFVAGVVTGALVTRNNLKEVNKVVEEAKELAAKAEAELAELKAKQKKPATRRGRKPAAKK